MEAAVEAAVKAAEEGVIEAAVDEGGLEEGGLEEVAVDEDTVETTVEAAVEATCLFTRLEESSLVPAGLLTAQCLQKT